MPFPFLYSRASRQDLEAPQNDNAPETSAREKSPSPTMSKISAIFRGWDVILFHSWLNIFLPVIPLAWFVHHGIETSLKGLAFGLATLALLPLVKLHDLTTTELALRVGGSKTGLLSASMANIVEGVVAIIALRNCELRVVHTSLVGAMLSKLLLVLGMCFLAGGIRFKEQVFDATATHINSSLLSISVGALMIPAVYHFVLRSGPLETLSHEQQHNLLHMSYGVSIILIIVYVLYIIFQFVSHPHLYKDTHRRSETLTKFRFRSKKARFASSPSKTSPSSASPQLAQRSSLLAGPKYSPVLDPTPSDSSDSINQSSRFGQRSKILDVSDEETIKLVPGYEQNPASEQEFRFGHALLREDSNGFSGATLYGNFQSDSDLSSPKCELDSTPEEEKHLNVRDDSQRNKPPKQPRLSWALIAFLLMGVAVAVAVVAELLVESMDEISGSVRKEFIGLIILPAVTAIAECVTAMHVSVKDKLTLSVSVAIGSTVQTALFVIPLMVILGWILQKPLTLLFDPFESMVLFIAVHIASQVLADGKSNWLEGVILVGLYAIIATSFWFYPGTTFYLASGLDSCGVSAGAEATH